VGPSNVQPYLDLYDIQSLLSSEQKLVAQTVRDYLKREVEGLIPACYEEGRFPIEVIPQFGSMGVLGSNLSGYGLPGMEWTISPTVWS
jgi:glutaryl-CoA dehydrogenase